MSNTVVVACRLPHGILAEVGRFGDAHYKAIKINGVHSVDRFGQPASILINGHAFTEMPEEHWEQWRKDHQGAPYLVNRLIYAEKTLGAAQEATKLEEAKGETGFEPLDPDKTPADIEADDKALKQMRAEASKLRVAR